MRYHGQLRGALGLGPKPGEEPFDLEDRRILATLGQQAAVAAENVRLMTALRGRAEEIDRLHRQLLTSREEERKRLAWELHDRVIQELLALYHYLAEKPQPSGLWAGRLAARRAQLLGVIDQLRQICLDLRPPILEDLGLAASIMDFVEEFAEQQGLTVYLSLPPRGSDEGLAEDVALTLFRALQEALRNVVQYAEAEQVWVSLRIEKAAAGGQRSAVILTVRDDGRGFVVPHRLGILTREGHFGLAGLKERVAMVGGRLAVRSAPGQGTEVVAEVPFSEEGDELRRELCFSMSKCVP